MSATDTPQSPRPSSWTLGGGGAKRHSSLHIVRRLSRSKSAASASATTSPSSSSAPSSFSLTDRPKSSVVPAAPNPTFTGAKDTHQTKSKYAALLTSFFADVTPILSVNPVIAQPRRALTMRPDLPSKRASTPDIRGGILSSAPVHGSARIKKIFRRSWTSGGSVSSTSSSVASTATFVSEMEYRDIEKALARFHSKERHRVEILRTQLIPWLQQSDDDVLIAEILDPEREKETAATKMMMIKWWMVLLNTAGQASYAERIFYFDCILAIMVRSEFDEYDRHPTPPSESGIANSRLVRATSFSRCNVRRRPSHKDNTRSDDAAAEYRAALVATMRYAVDRLNQRGVYANVIGFCAKVFALCFFKIPGVAIALMYALPVSRGLHKRMYRELGSLLGDPENQEKLAAAFPAHLHKLICLDPVVWNRQFERDRSDFEPPIEMMGNWVRRWQSDDSELFFTFYKHYHTLLRSHLTPTFFDLSTHSSRTQILASSPGYLYLSSFFLGKIDALLHRQIFAVTTVVQFDPTSPTSDPGMSPQYPGPRATVPPTAEFPDRYPRHQPPATGNPNSAAQSQAAAGFLQNGKPRVLEMASRRFAECAVTCAAAFGEVLGGWVRAAIERTSLYEVESVFCLLDFIESIIFEHDLRATRSTPSPSSNLPRPAPSQPPKVNLPISFLLDALALLLTTADHTVTLLRALSFVHAHFALLTSTPHDMDRLCRGILLSEDVFGRLMLHWAKNVRVYFIRVLVWRVARMGDVVREDRKEGTEKKMGENEAMEAEVSEDKKEGGESKAAEEVKEDAIVSAIFTQLHHHLYSVRMQYFRLQALAQKAHLDHEPPARIEGVDFVPARQEEWTGQDDNTMVDAVWPRSEEDHVGELMAQRLEGKSKMKLGVDDVDAEADTEEDVDVDADEEVDEDNVDEDELDDELDLIERPNEAVAVNQDDANISKTRAEVDCEQGGTANATSGARDLPERGRRRLSLYKKNVGSGEAERGRGRHGRRGERKSNKMDNQREGRNGSGQGILRFLFPGLVGVSMNSDYVAMDDETTSGSNISSTSGSLASSTSSLSTVTTTGSSILDTTPAPIDKDDDLPLRVLSKASSFYPTPSVALLMQPALMASASSEYSAFAQTYPPTKHAYAARALLELESVAHEQAAWEFDVKEWERRARGETGERVGHMPQVPGLFVEWPKYWNWEKPIM